MSLRTKFPLILVVIGLSTTLSHAQESPDASPPPAGVDKLYWDLSKSKDAKTKGLAERYLNLVKLQEWSDLSGKFKTTAKYVKHDANLATVTIESAKGRGAERTTKEVTVPVDKLSKTCQSRVKQIDTLQKLLKEAAGKQGEAGSSPTAVGPEGVGPEGQGPAHGPEAPPVAGPEQPPPPAGPAAAPEAGPDPSASEPDPLGFAEIANSPAGPAPNVTAPPPGTPPAAPAPAGPPQPGTANRSQWRTSFPAFVANLTVSTDPSGNPVVDWGDLADLRALNDMANTPDPPNPAAIAQHTSEVTWQLEVERIDRGPEGDVSPHFRVPALPQPLDIQFMLAEGETLQNWANVKPADKVQIKGQVKLGAPNKIMVAVRLAGKAAATSTSGEAAASTSAPPSPSQ